MDILAPIGRSLAMAFFMFWDTLWPLVLGFGLSGAVQAFVSRERMQRALGDHSAGAVARASFFGMVSSSCSYAASAMAKSLFQKGADFTSAMVFMLASTNLVVELGLVLWILVGWQFTAAEYVGGIIMITLFALLGRFFLTPVAVEAGRRHLERESGHAGHEHAAAAEKPGWRTLAGWADAAAYTMADLTMLRRELVLGYLIAGFLAVLVPAAIWNAVFFHGHGFATSVENAIVGPLIAVLSFVCSIGNVPLAAALWTGGISFGGVVAFIFADLITFPLLLIYRRMYGWALTLRLAALFWIVMAAGGLVTELLFGAVGLVPASRPLAPVEPSLSWNATTVLNLVALVVFAGLWWLARRRAQLGGGEAYAIDPVCGMQVEKASAPARATVAGTTYYFCSDRCRERFLKRQPAEAMEAQPMSDQQSATAVDPVCGMTVEKERAAATREYQGTTYYFCAPGCARAFEANPETFLATTT